MPKKAISVTLEESNLVWLQALAGRGGARSVSEAVDRLITQARTGGVAAGVTSRSVVGTIDIDESDPFLERAQDFVRKEFERSTSRPLYVREPRAPYGRRRRKTPHG